MARIGRLDEVQLSVADIKEMARFYEEVLEFREVFHHEGRMIGLDTGAAMLVLKASDQRSLGVALSLTCRDVEGALRRVGQKGVKVTQPLTEGHWGQRYAGFEDPEGNTIYLEGAAKRKEHHHSGRTRGTAK